MELVACKSCYHVHGDVLDECPIRGADGPGPGRRELRLDPGDGLFLEE